MKPCWMWFYLLCGTIPVFGQSTWLGENELPKAKPSPMQVGISFQEVVEKPLRENREQSMEEFLIEPRMDLPWFLQEETVEMYKEEVSGGIVGALVAGAFGAPAGMILGGAAVSALLAPEIGTGIYGLFAMIKEWMEEALALHDALANPEAMIDDILGEALASAERQRARRPGYGKDGEHLLRNARANANRFRDQLTQINQRMRAQHQQRMSADLLRTTALVGTALSGKDLTAAMDNPSGGTGSSGGLRTLNGTDAEFGQSYPDGQAHDVRTSEGVHYGLPTREAREKVRTARHWAGDAHKHKVRIIRTYAPYPGMKTGWESRTTSVDW